ncbi:MAG: thioredoxin domain-containing protein, partial [Bacteroidota bacterium]
SEGGFYAALDADSEGEEGKFYVWKEEEVKSLLGGDAELAADYFNINSRGLWEHGNHIPLRHDSDEQVAERFGITTENLRERIGVIRDKMLQFRSGRVRPGLDDKLLTSWNALAVSGLVDAYRAFGDEKFLNRAKSVFNFLMTQMRRADRGLHHSWKPGSEAINGFLEDYAFTITAALDLYVVSLDHTYVDVASELTSYAVEHFYDGSSNLFRFTSDLDAPLFVSKLEYQDNVIPASNSQMAHNLSRLSYYTGNAEWENKCRDMIQMVLPMVSAYGSAFSNWLDLIFGMQLNKVEKVVCGKDAAKHLLQMNQSHYEPYVVYDGATEKENTPATKNRLQDGKTLLYVCKDRVCGLPEEM